MEQRARAKHGWNNAITNSVVKGTISYFDRDGKMTGQSAITLYRKYPDKLRVEIGSGGTVTVSGFDQTSAWRAGSARVSEEEARDIRQWLRLWPDRLFITRAAGAPYREGGRHLEHHKPPAPGRAPEILAQPVVSEVVQIEDTIGPQSGNSARDKRRISYHINGQESTVSTARWLEPDDPRRSAEDFSAPMMEVRVEFARWQQVGGVLWPFEVTHWLGGKVDFRIDVLEVKFNQPMPDTLFHGR
ncbi:MAG TPA: hypothetical protein IGS52_22505 [Oscillatoriaceae cyanobacterium M33_DOE_052]|nr:hypothetical protein [Oscillatoriaceae cyanobacterium M33_DOE_052]